MVSYNWRLRRPCCGCVRFSSSAHITPSSYANCTDSTPSWRVALLILSAAGMMLPCIEAGSWNGAIVPIEGGYLADLGPALQVVLDTLEYGSAIKKTPVVVGNCTGFAVNRVFFPYTQAACLLVDLGLDPYKIDKAILGGFGMPMGPFRSAFFSLHV